MAISNLFELKGGVRSERKASARYGVEAFSLNVTGPSQFPVDPAHARVIRRLHATMMAVASRFFWWRSGSDGSGPYLQNSNQKPRPVAVQYRDERQRARTFYVPSRPTFRKFVDHVLADRPLFLTNRPESPVQHRVIDIDGDNAADTALEIQRDLNGHAFISHSRSKGRHVHLRIELPPGEAPERTCRRIDELAAVIRKRHPCAEAVKGSPVIVRRDGELLDDDQVAHATGCMTRYGPATPRAMSEFLDVAHSQHANFLVPCFGRGTLAERIGVVERFLTWHDTCQPIPLAELEQTFGIIHFDQIIPSVVVPTTSAAILPKPTPRGDRHELLKRLDDEIAEDQADHIRRVTGARRSTKLARMLLSESKPTARLGAMFAAVQRVGIADRESATAEARRIYRDLPAASDAVDDGNRIRQFDACYDVAIASYDPALAKPVDPIVALHKQATSPARFTDEQIDAMVSAMPAILAEAGIILRHNSIRGFVIGGLTLRKNLFLHENRIAPAKVKRAREARGEVVARPGAEIPRSAVGGMLRYYGHANGGSAKREIFEGWTILGTILPVAMHSRPHYDEHTGEKLVNGFCQCFLTGPKDNAVFALADQLMVRRRDHLQRTAARTAAITRGEMPAMCVAQPYRVDGSSERSPDPCASDLMRFAELGPGYWIGRRPADCGPPRQEFGWETAMTF